MPDRLPRIERKADEIIQEVHRLVRPQRLIIAGLLVGLFCLSSLAVGSVLSASTNCGYARGNRNALRSVLALARSATSTQRGKEFFDQAERLTPPIHCGSGVIASQVGRGAAYSAVFALAVGLVVLVAFPCGRRQLRRAWRRLRRSRPPA